MGILLFIDFERQLWNYPMYNLIKIINIFSDLEKMQLETVIKVEGKVVNRFKRNN
jgi:hypothetical protein